ncbi:MAG: OmpA family protein [Pseudomonadales bacterium]|nr:OmpA family protein [Pseudomonadales bacterium]
MHVRVRVRVPNRACLVVFGLLLLAPGLWAAEARDPVFDRADMARRRAESVDGAVLAPAAWRKASEALRKAEDLFADGDSPEKMRELLNAATSHFTAVETVSLRARDVLAEALAARRDASAAGADRSGGRSWRDAEEAMRAATSRLERDQHADVTKYREEALPLYRAAELEAIEVSLFAEAEKQIAVARAMKAQRDAPEHIARAEQLLLEARQKLAEDRYDTDQPRDNASMATHDALYAQYLAQVKKELDRRDATLEGVLSPWRRELTAIAELLDQVVHFDKGPDAAGTQLTSAVTDLLLTRNRLEAQVAEQQRYTLALQQEIETLQTELGGQSQARARLQAELERQAAMKARVERVEALFNANEAQVLRVQDRLVLRMIGISFASGSSWLNPQATALLGKVRQALAEFPDTPVIVEGHTDSHGADGTNLKLSKTRADAVMNKLLSGGGIAKELLTAVGYGETQPIASNETDDGRRKNRRIDIVLYPQW